MSAVMTAPAADTTDTIAERIIDAALAEFTEYGFRRVKVDDIARRAGIHRVTVYTRFTNKNDIVTAVVITWAQRLFTRVIDAVDGLPDDDRLVEGFVLCLQAMRTDPFVARMLTAEPEVTLPFITTEGGPVLAAVTAFFADQLTDPTIPDPTGSAELAARIGLSLVLTPQSHFPLNTANEIRTFAQRHLAPLLKRP